jgi:flagellin-specific chaperone FliS
MLYQVAIDSLHLAIGELKTGDRFARSAAVTRAQEAVHELSVSLDHSVNAPFTRTLGGLYEYILKQIMMGHSRESERDFQDALSILTTLAGTWSEVKQRVIEPAQPVEESAEEMETVPANFVSPYAQQMPAEGQSRDWSC